MSKTVRMLGLAAGVLLVAGVAVVLLWRRQPPSAGPATPADDPRVAYSGPYRNVHPQVKYVGDAACRECHLEIAQKYERHPMGRAMAAMAEAKEKETYTAAVQNPFEKFDQTFRIKVQNGQVLHRVERRDEKGQVAAATSLEAKFAVGSGTRGKSYFIERDGRLFQSPISWYSEKGIWDISPGYHAGMHFDRPINVRCLFCHCNYADAVDGPLNHYRQPIFQGYGIGCERCHGPGELHVKRHAEGEKYSKPDLTVVNPKNLEPALRDSVCHQCHLQGEVRVTRRGRAPFDFRPGLPVTDFISTFVRIPELLASSRSVGQAEQMVLSKCYTASQGKLGCISCHDPHERPSANARVSFYSNRCLTCHEDRGCSLPVGERKTKQPDDSCIACHMSKAGSSNIPHTAVTDHRILRRHDARPSSNPRALSPGESPVVLFHRHAVHGQVEEPRRDLAVALSELIKTDARTALEIAKIALPLLDEAVRDHPDDVFALEARCTVLRAAGRQQDALKAAQAALAIQSNLERSLVDAAELSASLGQGEAAIDYWRKVIDVNPAMPRYHYDLARLHAERREWSAARSAVGRCLDLDPLLLDARVLQITASIRLGEKAQAETEFKALLALRPRNADELRRWFATQSR